MVPPKKDILEQRLGIAFSNKGLLDQALTHTSALSPNKRIAQSYQRLEFLGDRVLGLVIVDMLISSFAKADEGELSIRLNALVRRETCAAVANDLGVSDFIRLGESEARAGGAKKQAILADICESLVGAIYLDQGLAAAQQFVVKHWGTRLSTNVRAVRDAKTALQEWMQAQAKPAPQYIEQSRTGPDHAPLFVIRAELEGLAPETAEGTSKKVAEHRAAEKILLREKVWQPHKDADGQNE